MFGDDSLNLLLIINGNLIVYKLTVNLEKDENDYLLNWHNLNLRKTIRKDSLKHNESPLNYKDMSVLIKENIIIARCDFENMDVMNGLHIG